VILTTAECRGESKVSEPRIASRETYAASAIASAQMIAQEQPANNYDGSGREWEPACNRASCADRAWETIDLIGSAPASMAEAAAERSGRHTFDKTVSSEPFAFAADAVLIYGYSMPFWYFSTIGEDADVWGEDFCGRWHALMILRIERAKQDCP